MSRVVRRSVTNRWYSGTQIRRVWMLMCCQRFVLMFEWETFWARSLRFPVISLLAMTSSTGAGKVKEVGEPVKQGQLLFPHRPVDVGVALLFGLGARPVQVDA